MAGRATPRYRARRSRPDRVRHRVPRYATVDLSGEAVDAVVARGKHLLTRIGAHTIHTHLKMEGSWQVYPRGARWRRPAHQARIVLGTEDTVAVASPSGSPKWSIAATRRVWWGISAPIYSARTGTRGGHLESRCGGRTSLGEALLDQRIMAGIGNVYRNEICFLRGVDPRTPTARVPDLPKVVDLAHRVLRANRDRPVRVTTGDRDRDDGTGCTGAAASRVCAAELRSPRPSSVRSPAVSGRSSGVRTVSPCSRPAADPPPAAARRSARRTARAER